MPLETYVLQTSNRAADEMVRWSGRAEYRDETNWDETISIFHYLRPRKPAEVFGVKFYKRKSIRRFHRSVLRMLIVGGGFHP